MRPYREYSIFDIDAQSTFYSYVLLLLINKRLAWKHMNLAESNSTTPKIYFEFLLCERLPIILFNLPQIL